MFTKILIANRGEIACRIVKTARRMGIKTVAVFSDADAGALHVSMADEAVRVGAAPATESYLVIERIVDACRQTGAEAVHPGYGFLSERAAFAQALAANGIVFIGPNVRAIEAMGDKIESKKFANAAKVSTVPGFLGTIESPEHAVRIADEIGYPVMIKASAGGGGKGMRVAMSAGEVAEGFTRARSEAASSFGDDRVFVEKFIVNPRHLEIQLIGDKHGNVVYLNERECSIQRRNQKVIEEAPSPLVDPAMRRQMGEQAVALARAVGYDSAGTVEFVAGQDKSFYFLEMNTRLQVEHPVTELITGLDLVEEMIRVAAGEELRFSQSDVKLDGWAVESRVYAEDPSRQFMPSSGRLVTYRPPVESVNQGVTVRNDTGVSEGSEISVFYDPMLAKLVTHAPTRLAAIEAQTRALEAFAIDGIRHNLSFLSALMLHPRWREGRLSTGFIAEEFPDGFTPQIPTGDLAMRFAAVTAAIDHRLTRRREQIPGRVRPAQPADVLRDGVVLVGTQRLSLTVVKDHDGVLVRFGTGETVTLQSDWRPGQRVWDGLVDGIALAVQVRPVLNGYLMSHAACEAKVQFLSVRAADLASVRPPRSVMAARKVFRSPMPCVVRSIGVSPGQSVSEGDPLAVVEAMKMEIVLKAEADGVISRVVAAAGQSLDVDGVILELS